MKSVVLVPYCPLPADTGGKREMWKSLEILKALGECCIVSAAAKPVGCGWTSEARVEIEKLGYSITLREESCRMSAVQFLSIGYAAICKALGLEKAFGHSNPYHRNAFPVEWWRKCTEGADLAVINYSYYVWLPCECPKVVVLHDLLSDSMWEGLRKEIEDLQTADLVVVISKDEEKKLHDWEIKKTLWSPPAIAQAELPLGDSIGCVGSGNRFNVEGLKWVQDSLKGVKVKVYGDLAERVSHPDFEKMGRYTDKFQPYRDCGIIILPTAGGTGVQIKAIESLACGRAIVARKGAMRGIPPGDGAWIEVDSAEEMVDIAKRLQKDVDERARQAAMARAYYDKHLDSEMIVNQLSAVYRAVAEKRK